MAFPESKRPEFERRAAQLVSAAYTDAFMAAMQRLPEHSKKAVKLLGQFAGVYGETPLQGAMIEPGLKLWRAYYEWTGDHMILTDEGWEPGEAKASYEEMAKADGVPVSDFIRCELNAPAA